MATIVGRAPIAGREDRFFFRAALVMAAVIVAGFSIQLAMGRSSFGAPLRVHVHALLFFGWVVLYVIQNGLAANRSTWPLHRTLGWLSLAWVPAMMVVGTFVTVTMVQLGHTPFFFQPAYFLVMNPLTVCTFAGLTAAAIVLRRRTQWHRRLMFCGMTILLGPAVGRLIPMPLLIPYGGWAVFATILLFPMAGIVRDLRASGRVHPAWWWGIGTITVMQAAIDLVTFSPLGVAFYTAVTRGTPGADIAPLAFPPFPH